MLTCIMTIRIIVGLFAMYLLLLLFYFFILMSFAMYFKGCNIRF